MAVKTFLLSLKGAVPVIKIIVIPLLAGAFVFGVLSLTGLTRTLTDDLAPVTGSVPAVLLVLFISLIPFISPLLGPGLVIAALVGVLTGEQIAAGAVTPAMALPAFCAIDALVGTKFIPPFYVLGETEPETINVGVPGVLSTRLITIPAAVAVAYSFSFVFFQK